MLLVGLTGAIGAGKSTFASLMLERGAQIIDADEIGRLALEPGQRAWHSVIDTFGDEIRGARGVEIDRQRLAHIVFNDRRKLAALNAIVHPVIMKRVAEELDALRNTDEIVILDAALLIEVGLEGVVELLIVVTAPEDVRRRRLISSRGMTPTDVDARMASQRSEDELLAKADVVVKNDGSLDHLNQEADRVWTELQKRVPA